MKAIGQFVLFLVGVALILVCIALPMAAQYAGHCGPEWMCDRGHPGFGLVMSTMLLMVATCGGGVVAIVCAANASKPQ